MPQPQPRQAWFPDFLGKLATASGIGYLAAAYTVSRWLTKPTPQKPRQTPSDHGLSWELAKCHTADGLRLIGWVVTPPRPRATVVLFHGVRNNREQVLSRIAFLAAAGYRCVAFDHRAHGESDGKRTSFGYYESRDVAAVLELVHQSWPAQPRAVLGVSMGAAALCYGAQHVHGIDAVILESLYHDIASAFANRINSTYPPSFRRLTRGVFWVTGKRLGLRVTQLAPVEHIGKLAPAPVLVLTGDEDRHATVLDAQRLFERCRGPREFWLVPGAGHCDVCETGGPVYQERILAFLERWLFRSATRVPQAG